MLSKQPLSVSLSCHAADSSALAVRRRPKKQTLCNRKCSTTQAHFPAAVDGGGSISFGRGLGGVEEGGGGGAAAGALLEPSATQQVVVIAVSSHSMR